MLDERHYTHMDGEPDDAVERMKYANEKTSASSPEAKDFIEEYAREVSAQIAAGKLTNKDLDLLEAKIDSLRDTQGH